MKRDHGFINFFGDNLKYLRKTNGFTMDELHKLIGASSRGHINSLEKGSCNPSLGMLLEVSGFFDISTDDLLKKDLELAD